MSFVLIYIAFLNDLKTGHCHCLYCFCSIALARSLVFQKKNLSNVIYKSNWYTRPRSKQQLRYRSLKVLTERYKVVWHVRLMKADCQIDLVIARRQFFSWPIISNVMYATRVLYLLNGFLYFIYKNLFWVDCENGSCFFYPSWHPTPQLSPWAFWERGGQHYPFLPKSLVLSAKLGSNQYLFV